MGLFNRKFFLSFVLTPSITLTKQSLVTEFPGVIP